MDHRIEKEAPDLSKSVPDELRPSKIPDKFKIKPSKEKGFTIKDRMKGFKLDPEEGYEKNSDYFFNSSVHFDIHEEMLNDKV
jgi:hypothetical protein